MRILRITVKNLASLSGEHTVDFTAEPLRSAGLFAIIGPTGSGKSTLLDAMCLALYDKTPRLKQAPSGGEQVDGVSQQDSRSLLRRGAWEGFAEVAFISTDGQTLTARWSVHRAGRGKKVAGRLQPAEMVLLRGDVRGATEAEQVCGGKKTQVLQAIEERIGLKFEQFTRAVLLAQNEFATFLRSKDDERMEILEALTGTHQFRAISQRVYQRASEEKKKIDELRSRRNGQASLTEAERAEQERLLQEETEAWKLASKELEQLQALKLWHEEHDRRRASLQDAKDRHTQAEKSSSAAEQRRDQLLRIERAQREARVPDQDFRSHQGSRNKLEKEAAEAEEKVRKARQALDAAKAAEELAQQEQHELHASLRSARAKLDSAIGIQPQVRPAEEAVEAADARLTTARERWNELANRLRECKQGIEGKLQREAEIREQLQAMEHLQPLAAESSLWIERLQQFAASVREEHAAREEATTSSAEAAAALQARDEYQAATRKLKVELDQHDQKLRELQSQVLARNGDEVRRTYQQLSSDLPHLVRLQSQLEQRERLAGELTELRGKLAGEHTQQEIEVGKIAELEPQVETALRAQQAAERAVTLLNNLFDDHAKRLRAALEPGEKCPVCGATEHPFAETPADLELSVLQAAKSEALATKKSHEQQNERLSVLRLAVKQKTNSSLQLQEAIGKKETEFACFQFDNSEQPIVVEILSLPAEDHQQQTKVRVEDNRRQQALLLQQINELDQLERQLGKHRKENTDLRAAYDARATEETIRSTRANDAASRKGTKEAMLGVRQQDRMTAEQHLERLWAALPQERAAFDTDPADFCRRLSDRLKRLSDHRTELKDTQDELGRLQSQEPQLKTEEQKAETEFQDRDRDSRSDSEKLSGLRMKLHELLGDQSIEQFRLAIEEQQESARKKLDNAVSVRNEADKTLTADSTRHESLQQQLSDARKAESAAQEQLHAWLAEFSPQLSPDDAYIQLQQIFGHDSNWIEGERKALQELADAVKTAAGEVRACEQRLEEHQRQRTDERDEAAVQTALATQLETEREAQARLQEVQRVLKNDDDTRSGNAKLDAEIQDLEVQARPWLDLDQLIGSADGKKFTLMAQRFTLDLLLQHANVQLQELAGRYRLERLGESLNLGVIDQDLGDELRSVHSLSGGETFLVSLALALGLASLTSSRLRIESLFIDEGFGSLDEDTLEVAMDALNHLQSQGRKVGVITHVERMQDAIATQIHVRRGPGGASRIVLPRSDTQAD